MASLISGKKIVCLGGGIGTSNLLRGLKSYSPNLTVVTSMADDGGSSGRLRKAYGIMPPGDIVSCIAALISDDYRELSELLTFRFPGSLHKSLNKAIDGHKLGNLIMFAEILRTGDFYKAINVTKKLFGVTAELLPATDERTRISAITKDGRRVHSETTLDLALYSQPYGLKKVYLTPKNPKVNPAITDALMAADIIISGPGDLYTNQLPVLIVPQVRKALIESKAMKIFILNVANKPLETKGFTLNDYMKAFSDHLSLFPFDTVIANSNFAVPIPKKYRYSYVKVNPHIPTDGSVIVHEGDFVNGAFPIYHDPHKLASAIEKLYNEVQ